MLLDGKNVANEKMSRIRTEIDAIKDKYKINPALRLLQVGNDPASTIYANSKIKRGKRLGIEVELERFDTINQSDFVDHIKSINARDDINGIMIESPLPDGMNFYDAVNNISFYKDSDGMTAYNQGNLAMKNEMIAPATARAVVDILEYYNIEEKRACIINRSPVVGRPLSMLLLNRDYTVTVCHSKTPDLRAVCMENNVVIVAVGIPEFLDKTYVTEESTVVDVGINYSGEKISGDADFPALEGIVKNITPVPGGVGIVTATDIFENFLNGLKFQLKNIK
ncbi:MAG: bifunctional 5,10-methylenetetrahydrofolate dehydrogenase/5,10-methenyltetrahydrofolate cyclohydrolase [Ferroplasma sp.]|uniref:bifunctional 5,10-methylenetetrahydrofolate dehydrogenase/5,10-methenyltetrahydrofolate cyclohydrolase n=1 Tax=Ferroplasma sp. TaxID=2591003 RepID=UPI002814A8F9|nr:bifunctional 5,10-methylenetetrahydrofolate dehydrogenase/5,10-methenyltetrahydrofolate cyclohydrolase [Ferroplasma sp.]WMT52248.1 MAG: bifunctional 5,10-methylenetetrahydrofolate dehydrogenase/5,10-methenyltetrahydrofolate cyclohydrolase [Ferroplasma sp.]